MFSDITLAYDEGECLYAYRTNHSATRTLLVCIWKISQNLYPLNSLQGIELLVKFSFNLGQVYCFWFRQVFFRNCVLLGNTTLTRTSEISCSLQVQSRGKLEGHWSGPKFGAPSTSAGRGRRQCLNELQKEYCAKTKVLALDWQWVTLRSRCQMNHNSYSSPVNNKVEGKPHQILEKLKITSGKSTLFGHFFVKFF